MICVVGRSFTACILLFDQFICSCACAVALARMLFPVEARVAMDIAHVDGTVEFTLGSTINLPTGSQRSTVDLNEAPFKIKEEHLARMRALSRTGNLVGSHCIFQLILISIFS